jgi:hypothetical protein
VISVSDEIRIEVVNRLTRWAEGHPESDAPVVAFRGESYLPRDLVRQVSEQTELGRMFIHSLYTSYLVRIEQQRRHEPLPDSRSADIMADYAHSEAHVEEVDLETFMVPIERMIVNNLRRG